MAKLFIHSKEVNSIFDLLGEKENDITFSLGWCLKNIKPLLVRIIKEVTAKDTDLEGIDIMLQQYGKDKGYTDIELLSDDIFCIIEAKKGWNLPTEEQLRRYANRFKKYPDIQHKLIVLSECKKNYAKEILSRYHIKIPIEYISWDQMHKWVTEIRKECNHRQISLLEELNRYFEGVRTMQDKDSNEVFCVVVSDKKLKGKFTFMDVVKKGYYFYPITNNWPKIPPTYIAFRHRGKLLSVHYVDKYEIVKRPGKHIPELRGWEWSNNLHYILTLGKPFKPDHEVKNGNIWPTQHIKFMLDTVFTSKTIQSARDMTQKRRL